MKYKVRHVIGKLHPVKINNLFKSSRDILEEEYSNEQMNRALDSVYEMLYDELMWSESCEFEEDDIDILIYPLALSELNDAVNNGEKYLITMEGIYIPNNELYSYEFMLDEIIDCTKKDFEQYCISKVNNISDNKDGMISFDVYIPYYKDSVELMEPLSDVLRYYLN